MAQASFPTAFLSSCSVLMSAVFKPILLHSLVVLLSIFSFIFLMQMIFILQGQAQINYYVKLSITNFHLGLYPISLFKIYHNCS